MRKAEGGEGSRIAGELTEELKREGVTFIPFYSPDYLRAKKI